MAETLKEIKEELQKLGISTDTPGIKGHDRREELANRLEEALFKKEPSRSPKVEREEPINNHFAVPDMANLSMAEIRSRLTMLGESTATPGLSGEDRRRALVRRLMESICGHDGGDDECGKDVMSRTFEQRLDHEINRPDPSPLASPVESKHASGFASAKTSPLPTNPSHTQSLRAVEKTPEDIEKENLAQLEKTCLLERKRTSELGEAKRRISAITNKRSVMISARFSGPMQDERLREVAQRLARAESEAQRVQVLATKEAKKSSSSSGMQAPATGSSDMVSDGKPMDLDKLGKKLADIRDAAKEKVKWHKTRIRCEEENHEEYGVEAETAEQSNVQEINFEISKIKRQIDIERARVGKAGVARWDLRQKELKAQQKQQELSLLQQLPASFETEVEEEEEAGRQYSFGRHGFPDEDEVSAGGGGGGGMFGPDVNFDDLDSQFNSMLTSGKREEDRDEATAGLQDSDNHQIDAEDDEDEDEDLVPVGLAQKAPSPPRPPVKPLTQSQSQSQPQAKKGPIRPADKPMQKAPSKPVPALKKASGTGVGAKVANDQDLDAFIAQMDPSNPANQLSTDDDVLAKKLALLRERSVATDLELTRAAPLHKEGESSASTSTAAAKSPSFRPPPRSSPQKTVLSSEAKPTISKKPSFEDKSRQAGPEKDGAGDASKESYRGEAEIKRMMNMKDDALLQKTKELERQMKSMAAAAAAKKKEGSKPSNSSEDTTAGLLSKRSAAGTVAHEEIARKQMSAAAPFAMPSVDPKRADKLPRNKNRPPPDVNKKKSKKPTRTVEQKDSSDAWQKNVKGESDEEDSVSEDDRESDADSKQDSVSRRPDGGNSSVGDSKRISSKSQDDEEETEMRPTTEHPEPTVLSPSAKALSRSQGHEEEEEDQDQDQDQEDDASEHSNEDDSEEQRAVDAQVRSLRARAAEHEKLGQYDDVEDTLLRALELNPLDMRTLDSLATFLHRKRGELGRAEAFYRRAIQVCVPSLMDELKSPRGGAEGEGEGADKDSWRHILDHERKVPGGDVRSSLPRGASQLARVHLVTQVLLHYATFLRRAKGDVEVAGVVLRKAADISPTDAVVLGACAHHLVEDNMSAVNVRDATDMFKRALKSDPANINNFLWYAKLLHKTGKLAEAELMFKVALQKTQGDGKMGAAATCNYAMFLYKYRNKIENADTMFKEGLEKHPRHKGLMKSYKAMLRDMKAKRMKEMPPPAEGKCSPVKETEEHVEDEDEDEQAEEEEEVEEEEVRAKASRRKKDKKEKRERRKKDTHKSSRKRVEEKQSGEGGCPDDVDVDQRNGSAHSSHDHESDDEEAEKKEISAEHCNDDEDVDTPELERSSAQVSPRSLQSPTAQSARGDSRGSCGSRGSSRGLRARLYERVHSAGVGAEQGASTSLDENSDTKDTSTPHCDGAGDGIAGEDNEDKDTDGAGNENEQVGNDERADDLKINTSFGTEDGVLDDELDDEVTAPDSFTQQLEQRGVITPHQSKTTPSSPPAALRNNDNNPCTTEAVVDDGGESVEISFQDITCYDIYMFHLRQKHGGSLEADAQDRISLYWTVKVYPDTYWEHETGTQRVSDEKNAAVWRFPADNDDSFAMKSNLHLCFLLFEATNDTLLGSAIFPGQEVVAAAGLAGAADVYEIDDEIICEDGVTVIGQLQAKVRFVR